MPEGHGTDLSVHGEGTDGAIVRAIISSFADVDLPAAAFALSGRLQRESYGAQFHDVRVRFGDHHARIDGFLGEPPLLIGTRLDIRAAGPGLDLVKRFVDLPTHDAPFSISGHLEGTPQEFALEEFSARFGRSDVSGSMHIDLRSKPKIRAELTSEFIDLPFLRGAKIVAADRQPDAAAEGPEAAPDRSDPGEELQSEVEEDESQDDRFKETAAGANDLIFPDDPLPIDWLQTHDVDVQWHMDEFNNTMLDHHNIDLVVSLQDGRLQVGPVQSHDGQGGTVRSRLVLEPEGDTYRLTLHTQAEKVHYSLSRAAENREQRVPHDLLLDLTGAGTSLHDIAGSADGRIIILQGEGRMDNSALDLLTTDVLGKLFSSLNPFSRQEPYTRFECGVLVIYIEQGVARLRPLIAVTDKMKIAGRGRIDLSTEKLDISWVAKPRKGIGLSASAITNPYIKLGGTLSAPALTVKPLQATTATAAAITTGGLSILAKGFWDRFTSGTRACEKIKKSLIHEEWKK